MEATDRRIQKTKRILSEAMLGLILEKGYEAITVQEIIDKANVGRSTFYSHYENKEQLLLAGPENLGVKLFAGIEPGHAVSKGGKLDFLPLFRHAEGSLPLAKAMLGKRSGDAFSGRMKSLVCDAIKAHFRDRFGATKAEKILHRYFSAAAASLVMELLLSWVEDDLPFDAGEMAGRCRAAVEGVFGSIKDRQ
jgi:AcrR family transcriptional regulator